MALKRWIRRGGWVGFWFFMLKGVTWLLIPMWIAGKGCGA